MNWPQTGALVALGLSITALLLLAISPLGWRAGWWHFRFAFSWLMTFSGFLAAAAVIVSLLVLVLGWSGLDQRAMAMAAVALIVGLVVAYVRGATIACGRRYRRFTTLRPTQKILLPSWRYSPREQPRMPPPLSMRIRSSRSSRRRPTPTSGPSKWCAAQQRHSNKRWTSQSRCQVGRLLLPIPLKAGLRPAKGAGGSASPTTSSFEF